MSCILAYLVESFSQFLELNLRVLERMALQAMRQGQFGRNQNVLVCNLSAPVKGSVGNSRL